MSSDSLPSCLQARSHACHEHAHLDLPAAGRVILRLLEKLQCGTLRLRTPDGSVLLYGDGGNPVTLDLHNWRLCAAVLRLARPRSTPSWRRRSTPCPPWSSSAAIRRTRSSRKHCWR